MKLKTENKCLVANKILQELNKQEVTSDKKLTIEVTFTKAEGKIKEITVNQ